VGHRSGIAAAVLRAPSLENHSPRLRDRFKHAGALNTFMMSFDDVMSTDEPGVACQLARFPHAANAVGIT
jgi:hypothetical protein